jgi:chromosome segregation ATPase
MVSTQSTPKMDQKIAMMDEKLDQMEARVLEAFHKAETLVNEVRYLEQPVEKMRKRVPDNDGDNMTDEWEWGINKVGKLVKRYMTKAELEIKCRQAWEEHTDHYSRMEQDFDEQDYFAWLAEQPDFEQFTFTRWRGGPEDEDTREDIDAQVVQSTNRQLN